MAALRAARKPRPVHVQPAAPRQAAVFRRDPARPSTNTSPTPRRAHTQPEAERPANPAWHIHAGRMPQSATSPISFGMLLNLASVVNAETPDILWGFIRRYSPDATPEDMPLLARLVEHAIAYYRDFIRPEKRYRHPDASGARCAGRSCRDPARHGRRDASAEDLQNVLYEIGKRHPFAGAARLVRLSLPGAARPDGRPALRPVRGTVWGARRRSR